MKSTLFSLAVLALVVACASAPATELEPAGPRGDSRTITAADISGATQLNLLDFIRAERPLWLKASTGRVAAVTVYVGDTRLGGLATLSGISLNTVSLVRYIEASAAQQRFNLANIGPVIQVLSH